MKAKKTTFRIAGTTNGMHYEAVDFDAAFVSYLAAGKLLGASKAHNVLTSFAANIGHDDITDDYGYEVQL